MPTAPETDTTADTAAGVLAKAVELRYRLPRVWARVVAGDLVGWRTRRIARASISQGLSPEAAAFVDAQVAGFAHKIRPSGVDRHGRRGLDVGRRRRPARPTANAGRAASASERVETRVETREPRRVVLYVHLSEAAVSGNPRDLHLGRVENTRSFVDAEQVKTWCANPDAHVTVKPVIDLAEHIHAFNPASAGAPAYPDPTNVRGCRSSKHTTSRVTRGRSRSVTPCGTEASRNASERASASWPRTHPA